MTFTRHPIRLLATSGLVGLSIFASPVAFAWEPKGPIKMLIAFRAGGGADTQARLIAAGVEKAKGWKIIPQQVVGKGGQVLARRLKAEPGDGLTIGIAVNETFAYNMLAAKKAGYTAKDFTYLTTTAASQMGLVAQTRKGWRTFHDVVKAAKGGGALKVGVMSQKLADGVFLLEQAHGVKFSVVRFKGGKGVLNSIIAGDLDFGWVAGIQAKGVRSGDLVNLASAETTPLKLSPNAPLLKDLGVPYDFGAKFMFAAPAGLKPEVRKALTDAITGVLRDKRSDAYKFITRAFGGPTIIFGKQLEKLIEDGQDASRRLMKASS